MTWNQKYWDALDQLYWTPKYLGLSSIPQRKWRRENGWICVPEELVNKSGPLYSRGIRSADIVEHLHRQEEILNHVFDITFAVAGDQIIERLFFHPLGFQDKGPFESVGREVQTRYGWGAFGNVTQQDGFFASDKSAIGVELKLRASTWPEQIIKYVSLLAWEEQAKGHRDQLGLLFIIPETAIARHWKKCGLDGPEIDAGFLDHINREKLNRKILDLVETRRDDIASVLDRLTLNVVSWSSFLESLLQIEKELDGSKVGDQTLLRLLRGFTAQLQQHEGTGINEH